MSAEQARNEEPRISSALDELRGMIQRRYPETTFQVARAQEDPTIVHLMARVDVEDTEEVVDLVIDRMLQLQMDEELPSSVIPLRTRERIAALPQARAARPSLTRGALPASTATG